VAGTTPTGVPPGQVTAGPTTIPGPVAMPNYQYPLLGGQ
jgi:hypothetical protein